MISARRQLLPCILCGRRRNPDGALVQHPRGPWRSREGFDRRIHAAGVVVCWSHQIEPANGEDIQRELAALYVEHGGEG